MSAIRVLQVFWICMLLALMAQVLASSAVSVVTTKGSLNTNSGPGCTATCTATLEYWDGSATHTFHPVCTVAAIQNVLLDVSGANAPQVIKAEWSAVEGANGWKSFECIFTTLAQGDNFAGYCNSCESVKGLSGGD